MLNNKGDYNIDAIFIGGLYPKHLLKTVLTNSKSGLQNAANAYQWKIVKGLDFNLKSPVKLFNIMFIGSFPCKYKKPIIKTEPFSHCKEAQDKNIGYCNLAGLKQICVANCAKKELRHWCKTKSSSKVAIIYSANYVCYAKFLKKLNRNVHICLILPDMPEYMSLSLQKKIIFNLYHKYFQKQFIGNLKYIDSYVFISKGMAEHYAPHKPYVIIEGMSDDNEAMDEQRESGLEKYIVYTGGLNEQYGIMQLIEAFQKIKNNNFRLILCGDGDKRKEVIQATFADRRIIYKGLISNYEAKKIQKKATILINPRPNNNDFTNYSFPSKIIEYMQSGRPVLCYKLDGIPDEYDKYLIYFKGNSVEDMKRDIEEIATLSEEVLANIGRKSKIFVETLKNNNYQMKRVLDCIIESMGAK